jgi:hypothetical protein
MNDIELKIPLALTEARIIRRGNVGGAEAYDLALELHAIVAAYRQLYAVRPACERNYPAGDIEEADVIETILRTVIGETTESEIDWLYERLEAVDGEELYERFVRLRGRIKLSA